MKEAVASFPCKPPYLCLGKRAGRPRTLAPRRPLYSWSEKADVLESVADAIPGLRWSSVDEREIHRVPSQQSYYIKQSLDTLQDCE